MSTSHDVPAGAALTLERVLALEKQVRELRLAVPTAGPPPLVTGEDELAPVERRRHDRRQPGPLDVLSPREQEVLELMASGCSNTGVARRLHLSERTVEATTAQVFRKLGLQPSPLTNRRVLAVLVLLRTREGAGGGAPRTSSPAAST